MTTDRKLKAAQFSADGRDVYLQLGDTMEIWRTPVAGGPLVKVFAATGDDTLYRMHVTSTGRILVPIGTWAGDLYVVPALPDASF